MRTFCSLVLLFASLAVALGDASPTDKPWIQCEARFYNKQNLTGNNFVLTTRKQYWINTTPKFWAVGDVGINKLWKENNVWMDKETWTFKKSIQSFEFRCISSKDFKDRNLIGLTVFTKSFREYNTDPSAPMPSMTYKLEDYAPEIAMTTYNKLEKPWNKNITSAVITFNWPNWYPGVRNKP